MEGRSIGSPCNIFGIGALLYYMIKAKPLGDHAWEIGMLDTPDDQDVKLYFGADLITDPLSLQQEYSMTLIRTILQCLAYSPDDRISATALLDKCTSVLGVLDNPVVVNDGMQFNPGDPATVFEPQREAEPEEYRIPNLKVRAGSHKPPPESSETLRARAEKWLSSFWLYPENRKSREARERQILEYERRIEERRREVERKAEEARRIVLADLAAREEQEALDLELARLAEEGRARIAANKAARLGPLALLPTPSIKRDRSPDPSEAAQRKKPRPASPAPAKDPNPSEVQEIASPLPMDVDIVIPEGSKGKEQEVIPKVDKGKGIEVISPDFGASLVSDVAVPEIPAPVAGPVQPQQLQIKRRAAPPAGTIPVEEIGRRPLSKSPSRDDPRIAPNPKSTHSIGGSMLIAEDLPEEFPWLDYAVSTNDFIKLFILDHLILFLNF